MSNLSLCQHLVAMVTREIKEPQKDRKFCLISISNSQKSKGAFLNEKKREMTGRCMNYSDRQVENFLEE